MPKNNTTRMLEKMAKRKRPPVAVGLALAMSRSYAALQSGPPIDTSVRYDNTPKRERNEAIVKAIDGKTATYRELADRFQISYTRVTQIYNKHRNHRIANTMLNMEPSSET